jgi:hypothetical protein
MARKPMVTRTLVSTSVNVLCLNVETAEPINQTYELARTFTDDDKLMKALRAEYETDTNKLVHIVDKTEVEKLYGMSETDFMKYAKELDPETRKPLADTAEPDTTEA